MTQKTLELTDFTTISKNDIDFLVDSNDLIQTILNFMEEKECKKRTEIYELPDGEFLSFLYSERDRENSLRQYQGWNIWALVGAISTVVVAGYFTLKEQFFSISFLQLLMLLSTAFAYLLCFGFVTIILKKERGVDYLKVKFLKDVAPHCYLWCSLLLSLTLSICIIVVNKDNSWNYVSIGWMKLHAICDLSNGYCWSIFHRLHFISNRRS